MSQVNPFNPFKFDSTFYSLCTVPQVTDLTYPSLASLKDLTYVVKGTTIHKVNLYTYVDDFTSLT